VLRTGIEQRKNNPLNPPLDKGDFNGTSFLNGIMGGK
jgi:hypothetical protein